MEREPDLDWDNGGGKADCWIFLHRKEKEIEQWKQTPNAFFIILYSSRPYIANKCILSQTFFLFSWPVPFFIHEDGFFPTYYLIMSAWNWICLLGYPFFSPWLEMFLPAMLTWPPVDTATLSSLDVRTFYGHFLCDYAPIFSLNSRKQYRPVEQWSRYFSSLTFRRALVPRRHPFCSLLSMFSLERHRSTGGMGSWCLGLGRGAVPDEREAKALTPTWTA